MSRTRPIERAHEFVWSPWFGAAIAFTWAQWLSGDVLWSTVIAATFLFVVREVLPRTRWRRRFDPRNRDATKAATWIMPLLWVPIFGGLALTGIRPAWAILTAALFLVMAVVRHHEWRTLRHAAG